MSAKWRAIQHRHRYTYNTVIFPPSYTSAVSSAVSLSSDPNLSTFLNDLTQFISLSSIYSQVSHSKTLSSSFTKLISTTADVSLLEPATCFYLEILFFENSAQLHRSLVSSLCRVSNVTSQELVVKCFRGLCEKYSSSNNFKSRSRRFCLSKVALSVMGMNKLGYLVNVIDDSAVLVAWDVVSGLESVVCETEEWARPSPVVMEQCQEALSCLYYLMQRFPERFKDDGVVTRRAFGVLISVLKSVAFSRDCYVAAGVSFCAGLQVCLGEKELGLVIMGGIFCQSVRDGGFEDAVSKVPYDGDLWKEVASFSVLSRLCLIRGILTAISRLVLNDHFVVLNDCLNGCEVNGCNVSQVKTILYDGILPELCNYCENPVDSHFNFHALTVMQICLQQIKTSILGNLTDFSNNYDPVSEEMGTRVLRIIWNNLEDPLSQTVKQVHLIFDLFLDIQSTLFQNEDGSRIKSFMVKIASDLLRLGSRCKGRYVPLALLTKRIGARIMLELSPNLLFETVQAYIDDDVCCAATTFLKCFLECLRDECWNKDGIEKGYEGYRRNTLPPFMSGLASRISKLRSNLSTYALPVLLEIDVDSVFPMLAYISVGTYGDESMFSCPELSDTNIKLEVEQQVCVFVSLLKVCRSLGLIEGDIDFCETSEVSLSNCALRSKIIDLYALVCIKGIKVKVQIEWLALALTHVDELLRVDAAESLFLNPKTSSLPSHLELSLLKEAVPLNMRSCSTGFQMKWTSMFRKFFSRVRTALERQFKLGAWQPGLNGTNDDSCLGERAKESVHTRAGDLFHFMRWLSSFLFFSCYPSAPYKRKIMAMELMLIMLNVWSIVPSSKEENCLYPYSKEIILPDATLLLVGSIVDSWDRLRESSFRILLHFPSPLPGISNEDLVQKLISWAKKLVCSPRVRESDAGALTLRLIFRKYVLDLGWEVGASTDVVCYQSKSVLVNGDMQISESRCHVTQYLKSLIDWLHVAVEDGERNLSEACKNSFVHGVLLTLRYTFEELDWNSHEIVSNISEIKHVMERLLELVMQITSLALWVVSADAWYLPEMEDMIDDNTFEMDELEMVKPSSEQDSNSSKPVQDNRPEQVVMVGCWLAMKEVSLLLGTIVRKIPLPSNDCLDSIELETPVTDSDGASKLVMSGAVLDLKQLEEIGNHFLEVLLKMKHNGAIDKTRAGFTALCNRLLCSNDPRLCKLTESWMEQLMGRTVAKGQVVDDLLRRSAGIPAAFIALFLSEPEGAPKKLLPRALRWLIDVVKSSFVSPVEAKFFNDDPHIRSTRVDVESDCRQQYDRSMVESISKSRDEGVIPTVHAFNVLRAAFNDTNLATDTSGFAAEAMIVSIRAFSSPYWEIRNSACLAYTALVRRMIGFLNVQKRESARRALTGLEFFHRYPSLHLFLYNELKVATAALGDSSSGHSESNLASVVHPSLCPMLILLTRLKPSALASERGDDLDPFLFLPYIRRCSTQSNLRVRLLASRALIGLVSNEKLPVVLLNIASELPVLETQLTDETNKMPLNTIHGILLQLCSLLDSNCRNLVDVSKKETILGELLQVLEKFTWIASPKWCPCPILNASFIRVLDIMLSVARAGNISNTFFSIRSLLLQLAAECLDMEDSYGLPYYDPTIAELREQAAISYYSCVQLVTPGEEEEVISTSQTRLSPDLELSAVLIKKDSFAGLEERLLCSLSDSVYEVRLATLKWLLIFLEAPEKINEDRYSSSETRIVNDWTKPNLQATMMKLLGTEKHHKCSHYILRIIFAWNLLQFKKFGGDVKSTDVSYIGNLDFDSVLQFWNKLMSLYKITRHAKTRQTLIYCMSICIKQYSYLFTSHVVAPGGGSVDSKTLACMYECITFFVNLIKEHSSSSEPVNMRKAAAESIVASGLLEQAALIGSYVISHEIPPEIPSSCYEPNQAINSYSHQVLEVWFTCIKLLEDEDDAIRQKLSVNVQKCISSRNVLGNSSSIGVPSQVDKVIDLSFEYLSSIFGHWIDYFDYLSQWVLLATNHMVTSSDLVRGVFDKEIDNHHEEKLLICQICCSYLEKLLIAAPWLTDSQRKQDLMKFLYRWRTRFCSQLTTFAKEHVEKGGEVGWIGGVGNHKDSFLPVYANLLGIYAVSNCIFSLGIEDCKPLLSEIIELGGAISTFFQNPMIRNLYSLVLKTNEKRIGSKADEFAENLMWDGFDPYFLRR